MAPGQTLKLEEEVDRGGQHDEPHSRDKDQDGHRHTMIGQSPEEPEDSDYTNYQSMYA
jgi:hypothetical protein